MFVLVTQTLLHRYNTDDKHGDRLWRFSANTQISDGHGGVLPLGNSSVDNTRQINERRFLNALIGDESQECSSLNLGDAC